MDRAAGLTWEDARRALAAEGPNVLAPPRPVPVWRRLAAEMLNVFAVMLWIASALAFIGRLPQLGVAIMLVVVFNGGFAFLQEYRAERAAEAIRDLLPRRVSVVRDGEPQEIDAAGLVHGDLVILDVGDRVSADLRAIETHALKIDTSTLTGESEPDMPGPGDRLFAGTFVIEGEGRALVEATGGRTRLAGIAELTRGTRRPPTPLAIELRRFVHTLAVIAGAVGGSFFVIAYFLLDMSPFIGLTFAIGVTVAVVPEALYPTVTLALAIGAQRMAAKRALVRRLEAVETLGSTTFICTDKTGTLTQNRMEVVEVWTPAGVATIEGEGYEPGAQVSCREAAIGAVQRVALAARICSNGRAVRRDGAWVALGDPMEAAIDALTRRIGVVGTDPGKDPVPLRRFPFDPRRRRMSVIVPGRVVVKGAPDAVLARCVNGDEAREPLDAMTGRGLRVIAAAERRLPPHEVPVTADEAESSLVLLGLLAFEDPPRPHVAADIAACRRSGMRLAMVTGDHPSTAASIARQVGLLGPEEVVVVGADLPSDDDELGRVVDRDGIVLARISPEEKLRVARVLRRRGHVVAMTGDGVNDGPALQEADIGVAMGRSGTDVAREAADVVLLDDDFSTIVDAIRYGRATFLNLRRFLTYHLTDNVAELTPFVIWAMTGGRFPLAIGVLQVLALDIGTDTLPAVALGAEPPPADVLDHPPVGGRLLDGRVARRAFAVLGPTESIMSMAAFVVSLVAAGWRPGGPSPAEAAVATASGAAFAVIVCAQLANAFACRSSSRVAWTLHPATNPLLIAAVGVELVVTACFVFVPAIADALGHRPPSFAGWSWVAAAPIVVWLADALDKRLVPGRRPRTA